MDNSIYAQRHTFTFCDGTTCEMTLSFALLKKMASRGKERRELVNRYHQIQSKSNGTEFDTLTVAYVAYVCANMDSNEHLMTEDEFIVKCGTDRFELNEAMQAMTNPKKRRASGRPSD